MLKKIFSVVVVAALFVPSSSLAVPPGFMLDRMGTMLGQVVYEGKPLANGLLAFFDITKGLPPIAGESGRIPDERFFADSDGKFSLKLLQGSYYIGVIVREPGAPLGPPRKGEVYYFANDGGDKLRKLAIEDYTQVDYGVINCILPGNFQETEDHFIVTGTVVKGAGEDEPYPRAIIMAKTVPTARRPEYISAETGADGKFSLSLPPGKIFYLMARTAITGAKPEPGEEIGKYGSNSFESQSSAAPQSGPPPGTFAEQPVKIIADEALPVSGENGQVVAGLVIHMYKMPDQKALQEELRGASDVPNYEEGAPINVLFATNSAELDKQSFAELDQWARFLIGRFDTTIELSGHTDNVGSEDYNLKLSEKRAGEVAKYLASKGIDALRIIVTGYGSARPVADNSLEDGRHKNRRVEIKFSK